MFHKERKMFPQLDNAMLLVIKTPQGQGWGNVKKTKPGCVRVGEREAWKTGIYLTLEMSPQERELLGLRGPLGPSRSLSSAFGKFWGISETRDQSSFPLPSSVILLILAGCSGAGILCPIPTHTNPWVPAHLCLVPESETPVDTNLIELDTK